MKNKLALILVSLSCFSAAQGASLLVDFSTTGGAQSGWETIGGTGGTGTQSGIFSGYTDLAAGNITVTASNISFNRLYKNGSNQPADNFPGTNLDAMYSDLLFRNNASLPVNVTIAGLKAGLFEITIHNLIATNNPGAFDLDAQDADSPGFGQFVGNFPTGTGSPSSFNPTVITFGVVSNGTDPIMLRMNQTVAVGFGNTGGWFGINGLEIAIVPEPSSTALLGLGLIGLFLRRRR